MVRGRESLELTRSAAVPRTTIRKVAHQSLAEGLQHRLPAQLLRVPTPGPGVVPPLSARFGYASPSGKGQSLGRSTLVIDADSIHAGRSPRAEDDLCVLFGEAFRPLWPVLSRCGKIPRKRRGDPPLRLPWRTPT